MTIPELKQQIDILEVGEQLGIPINKGSKKAHCPFHPDKTPSLQFSKAKQIATCFSGNCNAGTMDAITLVERKLNVGTHEACKYLVESFGIVEGGVLVKREKLKVERTIDRVSVLGKAWEYFTTTIRGSVHGKGYLESRGLNWQGLDVGYNNGSFHRGESEDFRLDALELGLLTNKNNSKGFGVLGNYGVVFPLKNKTGEIVSFYYRTIDPLPNKAPKIDIKHFYLKDRQGLYPKYPSIETETLIITESIIDCVSLAESLKRKAERSFSVLAMYGTNGLSDEHTVAVSQLSNLKEVVFWLDGDEAGRKSVEKYSKELSELLEGVKFSAVELPEGEDINSMLCSHDESSQLFQELLNKRKECRCLALPNIVEREKGKEESSNERVSISSLEISHVSGELLNTENPNNLIYESPTATYFVKGGVRRELDSLRVSLVVEIKETNVKSRVKLDLYEDRQTVKIAKEIGERLGLRSDLIEGDLYNLADVLDNYREQEFGGSEVKKVVVVDAFEKEKCEAFLRKPDLINNINELIGKAGVVGEDMNRIFLFCIASSHKMNDTLNALIQGSTGSGKTHLLTAIMDLMPRENCVSLTRVTESSFYNYEEHELSHKLIGIEDYDGLEEKAELAFRELQSKGMISSSTSGKNEKTGEIKGYVKTVYGPIASLSATTQGEVYEDNMSRCFVIAVDESAEQTLKIVKYQNDISAGVINRSEQKEIKVFLQNCIRIIEPMEVINPFANKIDLPPKTQKIRRLNDLFKSYVNQVTLLNQYQRKRTSNGALITEKADIVTAVNIMFESIVLKVDELDGSLRAYYESLKSYVKIKGKNYEFTKLEVRQSLNISKTQQHRFMEQLIDYEYIIKEGFANRGFKYKIVYWDNNEALRTDIKDYLLNQVAQLE